MNIGHKVRKIMKVNVKAFLTTYFASFMIGGISAKLFTSDIKLQLLFVFVLGIVFLILFRKSWLTITPKSNKVIE